MKKIIIPIVVIVVIAVLIGGGYLMIDSLFPKADPINVPSASSVVSMTVKKNENRNDGDLREIANADVDSILSKLSEANYGLSVFLNLLLPLTIIAIAEIVYALLLIVECIKSQGKTTTEKVFSCIGIWFAVMYLFLGVYIYRLVRLTILKIRLNQSTQTI